MNTFKLKDEKEMIQIPKGLGVITKDSNDKMVELFLNQDNGAFKKARIDRFFSELPKSMRKKVSAKVPEADVNPEKASGIPDEKSKKQHIE